MNNVTSKTDELKALEKIKNILAGLGEGSYLSYAFDGCVEYAEKNIEDDAAYSLRDELSAAYAKITAFSTIISYKDNEVKQLTAEIENLRKQITEYKAITPAIDDMFDIVSLLKEYEHDLKVHADSVSEQLLAFMRGDSSVVPHNSGEELKAEYIAVYKKYTYYKALRERAEVIYKRMD